MENTTQNKYNRFDVSKGLGKFNKYFFFYCNFILWELFQENWTNLMRIYKKSRFTGNTGSKMSSLGTVWRDPLATRNLKGSMKA